MGRLLLGVGVTVVIFAAVIIGYNRSQAPAKVIAPPRANTVHFDPAKLDLGTFLWGDETEFLLELVNTGDDAVVIDEVAASCDCTVDDLPEEESGRTIGPGERYPIHLKMNMGAEEGPKEVAITATTLDRQRAQAQVQAIVDPTWRLQHAGELFDFGQYLIGGPPREFPAWSLVFTSQTDQLIEVKPLVPWIVPELRPLPDHWATEIILRVAPEGLPPGNHAGWVEIRTDSDLMPMQRRTLKVNVARALLPTPDPIVLALNEEGRIDFMGALGIAEMITEATVPPDQGLAVRVEDGAVFVKRTQDAKDEQPIRIDVTTEDGRTGWAEVIVPDAIELIIPD